LDAFLISVGLTPELGLVILVLALASGIVIGGGTVAIGNSLPFEFASVRKGLASIVTITVGAGMIGIVYVIGLLFSISPSIPPVIISIGLGVLAGPLIIQFLGHFRMPLLFRSLVLIPVECLIITGAADALL